MESLTEIYDARAVQYLHECDDGVICDEYTDDVKQAMKRHGGLTRAQWLKQVRLFARRLLKEGTISGNKLTYSPKYAVKHSRPNGRYYQSNAVNLQNLPMTLRAFICPDIVDLDIRRCHHAILLHLIKNIPELNKKHLAELVADRDAVMNTHGIAKNEFLSAMYYDKVFRTRNTWLKAYSQEMNDIRDYFAKGVELDLNHENPKGSHLCTLIEAVERQAVDAAMRQVGVVRLYQYDGFSIPRDQLNPSLVPKLNETTKEWGLTWAVKELVTSLFVPEDFTLVVNYMGFDARAVTFNQTNIYVEETKDFATLMGNEWVRCSYEEMQRHTGPFKYEREDDKGKNKLVPIFKDWTEWEGRRTARRLVWIPNVNYVPEDDEFNTFMGFNITRVASPNRAPNPIFLEYFGLFEASKYTINFIAYRVQFPWINPQIAMIVQSPDEGVGKSFLLDHVLPAMFGREYFVTCGTNTKNLFQWGYGLEQCLFISFEEMSRRAGYEAKEDLKDLTTRPTHKVEPKGKKPAYFPNVSCSFITTNHETPTEKTDESRRYMMQGISSARKCLAYPTTDKEKETNRINREWWDTLLALLKDKTEVRALWDYFMSIDLTGWTPKANIPKTQASEDAHHECVDTIMHALCDRFRHEKHTDVGRVEGGEYWLSGRDIHHLLSRYIQDQGQTINDERMNGLMARTRTVLRQIKGCRRNVQRWDADYGNTKYLVIPVSHIITRVNFLFKE
jgi:hypothetical protein